MPLVDVYSLELVHSILIENIEKLGEKFQNPQEITIFDFLN